MQPPLSQIVDQLRTGLVLLDGELCVRYLNPSAEDILGRSTEQSSGVAISEILVGNGAMQRTLRRAMDEGSGFTARQTAVIRPDLSEVLVDCSAIPLSEPAGLLLEIQPLDAQLRMSRDDQIARQQLTSRRLTKGLAHEIKNPLGGIRGATQLLAKELTSPELHEYTNVILAEVDRLRDLVDRMLGPRAAPSFSDTNVHEILERARSLVTAEFAAIECCRDYDPSLPSVQGDSDRLYQVFLNIVRNGCQALAETENATLTLRTRIARQFTIGQTRHKVALRIDVEDNGPGVDDELRDRLFFPMISGRAEGTGLGLAMAQTIIAEHNGMIEFTSSPGQTVFTIYLPIEQPPEETTNQSTDWAGTCSAAQETQTGGSR